MNTEPVYVSSSEDSSQLADLTFDGTNFVAVWKSLRSRTPALLAARFSREGTVLERTPVTVAEGTDLEQPRLASDGHALFLAWPQRVGRVWRAMGRQFDKALQGMPAVALAKQPTDERDVSIAVSSAGSVVAVWEQDAPALGAMRVHASTGRTRAVLGTACGASIDCASGFCVDGVCCDSACGGGTSDCNACSVAAGAAVDGTCGPLANGVTCNDGNACTRVDVCQEGACSGTDPVVCQGELCRAAGSCDPATGTCQQGAPLDGAACDDGQACTSQDVCKGASCTGTPKTAPLAPVCQVVNPVCDPNLGDFPITPMPDGTLCGLGECRAGACVEKAAAPPPKDEESGCGCASGPGASGTSFLLLLTLMGILRRRALRSP